MANHPKVTEKKPLGIINGNKAYAWAEEMPWGSMRYFRDVPDFVFSKSLGRNVGLTVVKEIGKEEYESI